MFKANKILLNCFWCGKQFAKRKDRIIGDDCCGMTCKKQMWKLLAYDCRSRGCKECGAMFVPRKGQLVAGQGFFCSLVCSRKNTTTLRNKNPDNIAKRLKTYNKNRDKHNLARGENHHKWNGGVSVCSGYMLVPHGNKKYYAEHRAKMEILTGRELTPNEVVHHINGDTFDNRISNLEIMTRAEHASLHHKGKSKR